MDKRRQALTLAGVLVITLAVIAWDLVRHSGISVFSAHPGGPVSPIKDYSTPQNALLSLEDAYRRHDIDTAVASKDFITEARLMLKRLKNSSPPDEESVRKAAEVLELSFRKLTTKEWPDFDGLNCSVAATEDYEKDVIVATERCRFPDGGFSTQKILLSHSDRGWRVLNVVH